MVTIRVWWSIFDRQGSNSQSSWSSKTHRQRKTRMSIKCKIPIHVFHPRKFVFQLLIICCVVLDVGYCLKWGYSREKHKWKQKGSRELIVNPPSGLCKTVKRTRVSSNVFMFWTINHSKWFSVILLWSVTPPVGYFGKKCQMTKSKGKWRHIGCDDDILAY